MGGDLGGDLQARIAKASRMRRELDALRSAYEDFSFTIISGRDAGKAFEAVRSAGEGSLYSVITSDPAELRQILDAALT